MAEGSSREVRKYIFDYFLAHSRAPVLEEIMNRFEMERDIAAQVLEELEVAHHVIRVPGTNRILMANPFSALDTPFRVSVGTKQYFGACAWDAVAYHVMLGRETQVNSFCHHCADPIRITFEAGIPTSEPSEPLVYLSLPAAKWWENIVITCANHMVFFSSKTHLNDWLEEEHQGQKGEALTIDQTLKISIPIYKNKMRLDYTRPTKDESMAYWESMGLKGEFWRL